MGNKPRLSRAILFCLIVIIGDTATGVAQKLNTDSLRAIIAGNNQDTVRIDAMLALANYQIKHEMDDSAGLLTLRQANELATAIGYIPGQVQVRLTTGNYYREQNQWGGALQAYEEMISLAPLVKNDSLRGRTLMMAYNNLGGIYNYNGDFHNSLSNRLKALEVAVRVAPNNYTNLGIIYLNIASDYRQLKIPLKALEYLRKTTSFSDKLADRLKMEYYYEYYENYLAADSAASAKVLLGKLDEGLRNFDLSAFQKKDYALMIARLKGRYAMDYAKDPLSGIDFLNSLMLPAPGRSLRCIWFS